ncbi:cobalamin-binding protein [Evansella halocellulosilytica]|uniref:cobalamin-binding protein n=1 Tax=Evansella halocellulosilytica TaxID=2011013 RepID=UPI000BB9776F|nr:cobalamin-binding protein [Evansella halocellulosilytica]
MNIISICPSNTELLAYLGLTKSLIGVDDYSDWPKEIHDLPRLGPDLNINMDRVESLKPDLVLASLTVPGMEKNIEKLKERHIPYKIVPNPTTFEEIGNQLKLIGKWTNHEEKANKIHEKYLRILERYRKLSKQVKEVRSIYWEWWPKPVFTPGKGNWLTEMSELAGAKNAFTDYQEANVQTNWDDVKQRDPDVISLVWVGVQQNKVKPSVVMKRPGWSEMNAIKNNQLYVLEEPFFCRPSPRLIIGLKKIAHILHPDIYPPFHEKEKDPLIDRHVNHT